MPIFGEDDLIKALIAGSRSLLVKASQTSEGAGLFHSLWKTAGQPATGATPPAFTAGSGYVPDRTTTGAVPFSNPTSPALSYLARLGGSITVAGALFLYDRLWACSGFSTVSTSAQTITTPGNLPSGRDPNSGLDVEPWLEVYTAPGATGATWTLTGTDAAGNTNRTWVYTHPANAETVGQMAHFLPGGGSPAATLGIRQAVSLTCSISSGTAGDVGITLLRSLGDLPLVTPNVPSVQDYAQLGLPRIYDDSCLALMTLCSTTSTGLFFGSLNIGQQ